MKIAAKRKATLRLNKINSLATQEEKQVIKQKLLKFQN